MVYCMTYSVKSLRRKIYTSMEFKLHRFCKFSLCENISFDGHQFMPNIENEAGFNLDELKVLKSVGLIETYLEEGGYFMKTVKMSNIIYNVYLATKNNALWLMTNDVKGSNEEFAFRSEDKELENPYLVIEIRNGNKLKTTCLLEPRNLDFTIRNNPDDIFEDVDSEGDQVEILKQWPEEILACITEYIFDKVHIKFKNDEIEYTQDEIILHDDNGDISEAFDKNSKDTVKEVLIGDAHQYFEYDIKAQYYEERYEDAYEMLNDDNLKKISIDYKINSLEQLNSLLEEENDLAVELKNRLIISYVRSQEDADQEACRKHIIKTIEDELCCKYVMGCYHFTYGNFGLYAPRLSVIRGEISDLFSHDINFQFHDHYYGTIDLEFFNDEFINSED